MSLKGLILPTEDVNIPGGGSFSVRGISVLEIESIYKKHRDEVLALYENFVSGDESNWGKLAAEAVRIAPELISQLLVVATDSDPEDDEVKAVLNRLTPAVILAALERIGALTFSMDLKGKNFLEIVAEFATSLTPMLQVATAKLDELEVLKAGSKNG